MKCSYNLGSGNGVWGSTAAISDDGTIYCGVCVDIEYGKGGNLIAFNFNGTVKWTKRIADEYVTSSPCIAQDGTVYIGSCWIAGNGYFYAFGPLDPNAPITPTITGQTNGKIKRTYEYTFTSSSPLGNQIYYLVDWGDGAITDWLGPYNSGETMTMSHSWSTKGTYNITARAKDTDNRWGRWGNLSVTMPCSYDLPFVDLLERVLERFPNAFPILRYLLGFNQ
jgi:hypothetical protein